MEHILLRPDTYVGSTESEEAELWLLNDFKPTKNSNNVSDNNNSSSNSNNNSNVNSNNNSDSEFEMDDENKNNDSITPNNQLRMKRYKVEFVPVLYKIFDEILVNAADNKQRDPSMTKIEIEIKNGEKPFIKIGE